MSACRAAVILDVDGTLVDSNAAHARAWVDAFAENGIEVPYDRVRRAIGMGGDKLMPVVAAIEGDSPLGQAIARRRAEIFGERWLPVLRPFPGARELVERLARDGFNLAVASSAKDDEVHRLLEIAGVADLIPARTSSDDADHSKPDPDIVQAALKMSGCDAESAVMLGDTPYDVRAALATGIKMLGLECGGWGREDLVGAAEIYRDPADVLKRYDASIFAGMRPKRETTA